MTDKDKKLKMAKEFREKTCFYKQIDVPLFADDAMPFEVMTLSDLKGVACGIVLKLNQRGRQIIMSNFLKNEMPMEKDSQ
jgi:hypothetical protein